MPPITRRLVKGIRLEPNEYDDNFDWLDRTVPAVVTISSGGIITINGPGLYKVETFGGAGTDDLIGMTGGFGREWPVILTLNTEGRTITLVNTPPNFLLRGLQNFILNTLDDSIEFRDRTSLIWREVGGRCGIP